MDYSFGALALGCENTDPGYIAAQLCALVPGAGPADARRLMQGVPLTVQARAGGARAALTFHYQRLSDRSLRPAHLAGLRAAAVFLLVPPEQAQQQFLCAELRPLAKQMRRLAAPLVGLQGGGPSLQGELLQLFQDCGVRAARNDGQAAARAADELAAQRQQFRQQHLARLGGDYSVIYNTDRRGARRCGGM